MKLKFRLTRPEDFKRVRKEGKSYAHRIMVLVILPSKLVSLRIGITTSHSVGNAINRNRARRRIRASVDKILPSICTGFDIVFVARKQIIDVKFGDIFLTMHSLLEKAGVLVKQEELSGENWIGLPE